MGQMKKTVVILALASLLLLSGYAWSSQTGPVSRAYSRAANGRSCPADAGLFWKKGRADFQSCVALREIGPRGGSSEHPRLWQEIAGTLRERTAEAVWQVCRNIHLAKKLTVARYFHHVRRACNS
jgi:hypothetical protein